MTDFSQRIADLSGEKRKLLQQWLKKTAAPDTVFPAESRNREPISNQNKEETRQFYNSINQQLDSAVFGAYSIFLNYGYVSDETPQYSKIELPNYCLNRNSIKLVLEVIGDCNIDHSRILDIGCGRGGTIDVIRNYFNAREAFGIDLSSSAILFCRQTYGDPGCNFLEGDAEALPFDNSVFDAVTNLESSHRYPHITDFYVEVLRVLREGGYFLYADVLPTRRVKTYLKKLQDIGFILERDRDITNNVLLSCDETASQHLAAFAGHQDSDLMNEFLSVPGSQVYDDMKSGRLTYRILKFKKARPRNSDS